MTEAPLVTVVVPSLDQGQYLEDALQSICNQSVPTEVLVMDGGSSDGSIAIIARWRDRLAYSRSSPDGGQGAAINEGIKLGNAPYVAWLNSDDLLKPGSLHALIDTLERNPGAPAAYGNVIDLDEQNGSVRKVWVEPFRERRLALRCIISQPGTLIRRKAWEAVGGVDPELFFAMDYDLWWRLYRQFGPLAHLRQTVAVNRAHKDTKTRNNRASHYAEAMAVVRRHYGRLPLKWWILRPYAVWWKTLYARFHDLSLLRSYQNRRRAYVRNEI
jgi:glycosyltransferase involved in cell wall biosynthesis